MPPFFYNGIKKGIDMALIIRANGTTEEVFPSQGKEFTLEELQKAVDGHIEVVPIRNPVLSDKVMFCDEEGKLKNKPFNFEATKQAMILNDVIVGDVILCEPGEVS